MLLFRDNVNNLFASWEMWKFRYQSRIKVFVIRVFSTEYFGNESEGMKEGSWVKEYYLF